MPRSCFPAFLLAGLVSLVLVPDLAFAKGPIANGGGTRKEGNLFQTIAFSAVANNDGYSGQIQVKEHLSGNITHGDVFCVRYLSPTSVIVGARIVSSSLPQRVGLSMFIEVHDNGKSKYDTVSGVLLGQPHFNCFNITNNGRRFLSRSQRTIRGSVKVTPNP